MNLIDACIDSGVKRLVALSTDKASSPINLYGATKLCSDKIFIAGNSYTGGRTKFAVVRYGNVMGSRGSVIPFFMETAKTGKLTITDKRMTRFMISLEQGVELVWHAFDDMEGAAIERLPETGIQELLRASHPVKVEMEQFNLFIAKGNGIRLDKRVSRAFHPALIPCRTEDGACQGRFAGTQPPFQMDAQAFFKDACQSGAQGTGVGFILQVKGQWLPIGGTGNGHGDFPLKAIHRYSIKIGCGFG